MPVVKVHCYGRTLGYASTLAVESFGIKFNHKTSIKIFKFSLNQQKFFGVNHLLAQ